MAKTKEKKPAKKQTKKLTESVKPRKLQKPKYRSFRYSKKIKTSQPKVNSSWKLLIQTLRILKNNWKFFLGFVLIYSILVFVLVKSLNASVDISSLKETFSGLLGQSGNGVDNVVLFGLLLGSSASTTDIASIYQALINLFISLALIYGIRVIFAQGKEKPGIKTSFYNGMTPLVPVVLVLLVIGLQMIPLSVGVGIYATVLSSGIAVTLIENIFWIIFVMLLALLSLYMLSSSIFALYMASLSGVEPLKALKGARELVRHRRWMVVRKVVALPLFLILVLAIIVIPFIALLPALAEAVFFVMSAMILPFVHVYMYGLYRQML